MNSSKIEGLDTKVVMNLIVFWRKIRNFAADFHQLNDHIV